MSWKSEHGAEYEVPAFVEFLVKRGILKDESWHNDMSPSFWIQDPKREDHGLRLWVDHPIKSLREAAGKRFMVQEGEYATEADFEHETDDLEEVLGIMFKRAVKYLPGTEIAEDPVYALEELIEKWRKGR